MSVNHQWEDWRKVLLREECKRRISGARQLSARDWEAISQLVGLSVSACRRMWQVVRKEKNKAPEAKA